MSDSIDTDLHLYDLPPWRRLSDNWRQAGQSRLIRWTQSDLSDTDVAIIRRVASFACALFQSQNAQESEFGYQCLSGLINSRSARRYLAEIENVNGQGVPLHSARLMRSSGDRLGVPAAAAGLRIAYALAAAGGGQRFLMDDVLPQIISLAESQHGIATLAKMTLYKLREQHSAFFSSDEPVETAGGGTTVQPRAPAGRTPLRLVECKNDT